MAVTGKGKKMVEFSTEKLTDKIFNLIMGLGNSPMRIERVIVLKGENIRVLALNVAHWLDWLKTHANTEYLWSKISEEKGEWRCEIHYMSDNIDPPEE